MKSYKIKTPELSKTKFHIDSSLNFLENERSINGYQRAVPPQTKNDIDICEPKQTKPSTDSRTKEVMSEPVIVDSRIDTSGKYPKRYVTKCYFEPRQVPVKYSETMIVKIGSKKKQYFESIYYENKLEPNRWREQVSMVVPEKRDYDHKTEIKLPLQGQDSNCIELRQPTVIVSEL